MVVCCPRSDWVLPFTLSCPSCIVSPLLLSTVCVLCHSIVGLGLCLCDRVVSLWNSGDGLCWVEGRVVFIVYTSLCCGVHLNGVCCDDSA